MNGLSASVRFTASWRPFLSQGRWLLLIFVLAAFVALPRSTSEASPDGKKVTAGNIRCSVYGQNPHATTRNGNDVVLAKARFGNCRNASTLSPAEPDSIKWRGELQKCTVLVSAVHGGQSLAVQVQYLGLTPISWNSAPARSTTIVGTAGTDFKRGSPYLTIVIRPPRLGTTARIGMATGRPSTARDSVPARCAMHVIASRCCPSVNMVELA